MDKTITLPLDDWQTLVQFANKYLGEIADYDDEDEEYVAVRRVVVQIERQLSGGQR